VREAEQVQVERPSAARLRVHERVGGAAQPGSPAQRAPPQSLAGGSSTRAGELPRENPSRYATAS
jgi:hypothetical protein